jgi:phosphomannomutase
MFKPKLMAFDLDDTLAESKQRVSADMGELLSKLLEKMPVAILSGGAYSQFETQIFPSLPSEAKLDHLYLFPTSAAQCFVHKNGSWTAQYDFTFTPAEREKIMHALTVAMEKTGFAQVDYPLWGERIQDRGAQITFSGLGQQAPIAEKKKWDPDKQKRRPLYDQLVQALPDFRIAMNAATSIDITRKGINKAYGIRQLPALTGITINEMLYVGDALVEGGNDSVVIETGIKTHEVFGPKETAALIEEVLRR